MPRSRPTLLQLRDRIANDLEYRLREFGADAHSAGTGYTELALVNAAIAHGLYGDQDWIARQLLIATCDPEVLVLKADEAGIPQIAAQFASAVGIFTGTNDTPVPSARMYQTKTGIQFRTSASGVIAGGSAAVALIAQAPGSASNLPAGAQLTAVVPLANVDNTITLQAPGATGGADIESIARLRVRMLDHARQPPMGGKDYDYVAWAKAASVDVTRVWVTFHEAGIGSVNVRFVCEDLADPIPTAPIIAAVQDFIVSQRPAGLRALSVTGATAKPMNLAFTALNPNNIAVKAAIEAEVKDLIRREYVSGGTLLLTHIRQAISNAAGEEDYVITLAANLNYAANEYPTWGVPTWP